MQNVPTGWEEARRSNYWMETKVSIAGVEYLTSDNPDNVQLWNVSTRSGLFFGSKVGIGGCVASEIDLTVMPQGDIPRMAEIIVWVRLVTDDIETDWIKKGVFYIDTRHTDKVTGQLTIHGYDAMLKAELPYLGSKINDSWPQKAPAVAAAIAQRMGLTLDPRSVIAADDVPMPLDLTMREVLSDIAAANAGNWTVTDTGTLRLVPLRSIPSSTGYLVTEDGDAIVLGNVRLKVSSGTGTTGATDGQKTYVGLAAQTLEVSPALPAYTGVTLEDADGVQYSAGTAGMVLTAYCSWATQAVAERVLTAIKGYAYRPFSAACAVLDPAAELGDGVTVGGVYSVLAASVATFDGLLHADISAPAEDELDHEYPYETPEQRSMKRGFKAVYSTIEKTDTAIRMEVGELSGKYAALALTVDGFTVTDASGTTRIKGSSIETSTLYVDAAHINGTLTADQINLSGSISWADLDSGVQSEINNAGGYSKSQIKTFINESLVASPNIAGATFYDLSDSGDLDDSLAFLELNAAYNSGVVGPVLRYVDNQNGHEAFKIWTYNRHCYMGLCGGFGWVCSPDETDYDSDANECQVYHSIGTHSFDDKVRFEYEVEFASGCRVTGLTQTYVPVWG